MNTNAEMLPAEVVPGTEPKVAALRRSTLRFVIAAAIAGMWFSIAFVQGGSRVQRALAVLVVAGMMYAGQVLCLRLAVRSSSHDAVMLEEQLSRCSLATLLLVVFLPEYAGRVHPPLAVSLLLAGVCAALWAALCALVLVKARPSDRAAGAATAGFLLAVTGVATALAVRKYEVFGYVGQDLAYFGQIVYSTAHGHLFRGSLLQDLLYSKRVATDFAGHNSPAMFVLVPFYWLWPSPVTLIAVRNLLLLLAAVPVYLLARRRGATVFAACLWVVAFFLTPSILLQNVFDFYPLTLAAVPLLFCVYFFVEGRFAPFVLACVGALLVREDLAFAVCLFSVLALLARRSRRWVLVPALAGVVWLALSFEVVLPAALHGAKFVTDACFGHLGRTPAAMLANIVAHPRSTLLLHGNVVYLKSLLSPTGIVLGVASPIAWLAAPLVAINLAAGGGPCTTTMIAAQYSVVPATALFAGALMLTTARGRSTWLARVGRLGLADPVVAPLLLIACSFATLLFTSPEADGLAFRHQPWEAEAYRVLRMVPAGASVAAPRYMLPHLANRECLYQTHRLEEYHHAVYEYLVIDNDWRHIDAAAIYQAEYERVASRAESDSALQLVYASAQYRVYRNPSAAGVSCWAGGVTQEAWVRP